MTLISAAELGRYGVRANAIAPVARTRLSAATQGPIGELMKEPEDPHAFDPFHARQVSPLVAWLASEHCPVTGKLYLVQGGTIAERTSWQVGATQTTGEDWTIDGVAQKLGAPAAAG